MASPEQPRGSSEYEPPGPGSLVEQGDADPIPKATLLFPNDWVMGNQSFEVSILERYNIAVANINPNILDPANFPIKSTPVGYSDEVFGSFVDKYADAFGRIYQTKTGRDLLDVIAKGKPLATSADNQWCYMKTDGSVGLSDTQLVIFPTNKDINGCVRSIVPTPMEIARTGTATSLTYNIERLMSYTDDQGRLLLNDPLSTFFHELVHVPQDIFGLEFPLLGPEYVTTAARLPIFKGKLGDGRYPREIIEEIYSPVEVMETFTHGGKFRLNEMRDELISHGYISSGEYPTLFHNPHAKKALDEAIARDIGVEQIDARWLYYTTNPTEAGFADEIGAIVRDGYTWGGVF